MTVRLAKPLRFVSATPRVELEARCGDVATRYPGLYSPPIFADSAGRPIRVPRGARTISTVLPRDVASRANLCVLREVSAEPEALYVSSQMRLRRGTAPGCRPGRAERVVHRSPTVLVTEISTEGADEMSWEDVYRYCRLPGGHLTPLAELRSGGGGGGGAHVGARFASAGNWLAWSVDYSSHAPGGENATVEIVDVRSSMRSEPTRFHTAPGTHVATNALDVAANGTAVWVERVFRSNGASGEVEQKLRVGWQFGRTETIASWTGPPADEQANALTDVAISEDGRTVTWRAAGQERSATVAVPDESDPSEAPAVASGASARPAARFRLVGRDLTVTFDQRLMPRGFSGRPSIRVVCGDSVADPAGIRSLDWLLLAAKAERSLRVSPGARIVRARLDANVAARANWCGLRVRSSAGNRFASATMSLREGTSPACVPTAREEVLVDTEQLLVTRVRIRPTSSGFSQSATRACGKATGVRRTLGASGGSLSGTTTRSVAATAGARVAVTESRWDKYNTVYPCSLQTIDMAQPSPRLELVAIAPEGEPERGRCARSVALDAAGRLAWVLTTEGESTAAPERIAARAADGRTVVLATAGNTRWDALADIAISADGTTVTWREEGVQRSAPMP